VYEWVNDYYSGTYYASGATVDPAGPTTGTQRVNRGGGWDGFSNYARSSFRNWATPDFSAQQLGFRVARHP
jgi:formylglycine-generating enzyme required for sulfatase activity